MRAEIIASGTELLLGEISDTNTSFIAGQLALLGIDLYYASIVGDNFERFAETLRQAMKRSDIVFITGGLGPTKGDITREVIAGVLGEKMEVDGELKQQIVGYFERMHLQMTENNLKQAALITSATGIPNPLGTAPGWWVEKAGKTIVCLPGPPAEMQPMWAREVFPRLEKKGGAIILSRNLKTWGLSEAAVDQLVSPFMGLPNPTLALYARPDGIRMRITAKADSREKALYLIQQRETELRDLLKEHIWGIDDETLETAVARLLMEKHLTIAVAESFTGGLLSYTLSSVAESARFFTGSIILPDRKALAYLEISPFVAGQTSIKSASFMASAVREKFGADLGVAIDGSIENAGEAVTCTAYIAIDMRNEANNVTGAYPGRPYLLVRRSAMHALFSLRAALLKA